LNRALPIVPIAFSYKEFAANKSLYNTPPTFSIYLAGLMFKWALEKGGVKAIEQRNIEKSNKIYQIVDSSEFWRPCVHKAHRSRVNITLIMKDEKPGISICEGSK